ncbi:efflux RND transporter periplasmic adaptor subunit [Cupriavidus gilardii]|uniref:Efflux RND transporter periplasmic adaptor subunit n=1 Tax=Cupriavidus gilardii TaxID=82541 RepID=A0A6N1B7W9_9BURK|nr:MULTISPECIES: efflux RND transporter periplasmic adaptor subunit [Cupriavidus]ALD93531.1 cation/multidrug efflux system, mebrane-fusion component [Cupriavidus gilardii CR3]ESJ26758.1 hemolysin secretion protein D [Cupriavidus sp. HPC(L)]KAB0595563.1 efflux RND transporter periplasmic adaptor subunit [Cupriavidus gilardii]MCD9119554.1 efflux RND transporter periplasmic adaptor subunit [Cupriavidus sp. UGS-1]MCT9013447.1 efflux RND transporter periplasmic adaptor subunit [Cupriavidus gilardii
MKLQSRRSLIAVAIVIVLGTGLATTVLRPWHAGEAQAVPSPAPSAAAVDVAAAIGKTITEWDEFSGRLEAIDRVEVRPRVGGTIDAVHFREGAMVKKGDLLFTIDPRPYAAEVARAEAALAAAQVRASHAQSEQVRAQRLLDDNAISRREFDERIHAAREANANVRAAQAALDSARLNLAYTRITSPVTGRVSRAEITVGNLVAPGANSPALTTVVSVSPVYASFEIDEQSYLRYTAPGAAGGANGKGMAVYLGLANEEGHPHEGRIQSVDNRLDPRSGTIRVRAVFDNPDGRLLPGLYAKVKLGGNAPHDAVLINDRAIGTDQGKKFVLVVDKDNKLNYREVQMGPNYDGLRVIRSGLKAGEVIVVNGLQRVRPGDTVAPTPVRMALKRELERGNATEKSADNQPEQAKKESVG